MAARPLIMLIAEPMSGITAANSKAPTNQRRVSIIRLGLSQDSASSGVTLRTDKTIPSMTVLEK